MSLHKSSTPPTPIKYYFKTSHNLTAIILKLKLWQTFKNWWCEKSSGLTFSISCAGEVESAAPARSCLSSLRPRGGLYHRVRQLRWPTGAQWYLSLWWGFRPVLRSEGPTDQNFCLSLHKWRSDVVSASVTEAAGDLWWLLPRWRCRKASVALLERLMATSGSISPFSFISFPIQLPVRKVKSGKLWCTVPLVTEGNLRSVSLTDDGCACGTWWWSSCAGWRKSPASSCDWCSPPTGTSPSWWKRAAAWPRERSRPPKGTSRRPARCHTWTRSSPGHVQTPELPERIEAETFNTHTWIARPCWGLWPLLHLRRNDPRWLSDTDPWSSGSREMSVIIYSCSLGE